MAVMNFESGLNPKAVNKFSGATGLIQFMPNTAKGLGTTTSDLYKMSNVKQLDYVYRYYKPYASKITRYVDLYLATIFPAALNKSKNYVLQTDTIRADTIATQNPVFDKNKDKKITVGEIEKEKLSRIPLDWVDEFKTNMDSVGKFAQRNWLGITVSILTIATVAYFAYRHRQQIIKNIDKTIS